MHSCMKHVAMAGNYRGSRCSPETKHTTHYCMPEICFRFGVKYALYITEKKSCCQIWRFKEVSLLGVLLPQGLDSLSYPKKIPPEPCVGLIHRCHKCLFEFFAAKEVEQCIYQIHRFTCFGQQHCEC